MRIFIFVLAIAVPLIASGAPRHYEIDPEHTFPSFEADHMGLSLWRGKFNRSSGEVTLDQAAETGAVEVAVDLGSIDFGHEALNEWAAGPELFDVQAHPRAVYQGQLAGFEADAPTRIDGELTLNGITKPLTLQIHSFRCMPHPLHGRELCGADASGTFQRDDFGLDVGAEHGFDMGVTLRIQVEAIAREDQASE